MRMFSPSGNTNQSSSRRRARYYNRWDYRWDTVPKECKYQTYFKQFDCIHVNACSFACACALCTVYEKFIGIHRNLSHCFNRICICQQTVYTDTVTLSDDSSIMTYRGHRVKKTLIRAKFSPQETTGQRYIYTGCGTGRLISMSLFCLVVFSFVLLFEGNVPIARHRPYSE